MTNLKYYLCGGAGINIGLALREGARTSANKKAELVGFDSSDKNNTDKFPIERIDGVSGSGKDSSLHFEALQQFVAAQLKQHKPGRHNVVVANSAGGTGRALAMLFVNALIKAGEEVVLCISSDHTSFIEQQNSVKGSQTFYNQVGLLKAPICYIDVQNTADKTRGQVNKEIVDQLNLLSILFNEGNTEIDLADIKRLFNYSASKNSAGAIIQPAFSRIRFWDQEGAKTYSESAPVAVASLFRSSDEVIPRFTGAHYRATGVFSEQLEKNELPDKMTELHIILDHGDAYDELKADIDQLEANHGKTTTDYGKQKELGGEGANEMGFML